MTLGDIAFGDQPWAAFEITAYYSGSGPAYIATTVSQSTVLTWSVTRTAIVTMSTTESTAIDYEILGG